MEFEIMRFSCACCDCSTIRSIVNRGAAVKVAKLAVNASWLVACGSWLVARGSPLISLF
jgi:hypothetical protein